MQNSRTWSNGPCLIFGTRFHPTAPPERRGRRSAASARDVRIRAREDLPERPPGRTSRDGQVCTHTHLIVRYLVLLVLSRQYCARPGELGWYQISIYFTPGSSTAAQKYRRPEDRATCPPQVATRVEPSSHILLHTWGQSSMACGRQF